MGSIPITRSSFPSASGGLPLSLRTDFELRGPGGCLKAPASSLVLLTGPIGSGKSRWLERLAGLAPLPKGWSVSLCGSSPPWAPHRVYYRPDRQPPVWLAPTLMEEVRFGLTRVDDEAVRAALARWELDGRDAATPCEALPRDAALRLALASAELAGSLLVLLDEPLAGWPEHEAHAMAESIRAFASRCARIVVVATNRWQDWRNLDAIRWRMTPEGPTMEDGSR